MSGAQMRDEKMERPRLERISLLKAVLQGFRIRLDEKLLPLGITASQLRLLWTVEANPLASGAEVARLCAVTPQTGQATMARLEANGWVRRKPSAASERVLVAELTSDGRKLLRKAREIAEDLDSALWRGLSERELSAMEHAVGVAAERLKQR